MEKEDKILLATIEDKIEKSAKNYTVLTSGFLDLRQRGLVTAVGTNMTLDWQLEKLSRLGLLEEFSLVVSSEEAGAAKPEKAFFLYCAEQVGRKRQRAGK